MVHNTWSIILSAVGVLLATVSTYVFILNPLFSSSVSIDPLLQNSAYLETGGYLVEGEVPVLISLNLTNEVRNSITPEYRKEYHEKLGSFLLAIGDQFQKTMDLKISGGLAGYLKYSKTNLDKLKAIKSVTHVHLDKKVKILMDESRDLTNTPPVYNELDQYGNKLKGTGITVAVLDTGIDAAHPDLDDLDDDPTTWDPKVTQFVTTTTKHTPGVPPVLFPIEGPAYDDNGHGTHVAGIVAGTGKASDGRFQGIAPKAKLMGVKILDASGSGNLSAVALGVESAIDPNQDGNFTDKADIISMSLGVEEGCLTNIGGQQIGCQKPCSSDHLSSEVAKAIRKAIANNIIVVIAAGNSGPGAGTINFPGCMEEVITVGSTDKPIQQSTSESPIKIEGDLSNAALDGTWTLNTFENMAAVKLEFKGTSSTKKTLDLFEKFPPSCGDIGGSLKKSFIAQWNWHVSRVNYPTGTPLPTDPEISPTNYKYFPGVVSASYFLTEDDVFYVKVGSIYSATIIAPDGKSMKISTSGDPVYYLAKLTPSGDILSLDKIYPDSQCGPVAPSSPPAPQGFEAISSFSSRGPTIQNLVKPDIVSPGGCITAPKALTGFQITALAPLYCSQQNTVADYNIAQYVTLPGTSMSTPMVSGIIALLKQERPDLGHYDFKRVLKETATLLPNYGPNDQGSGKVNALKAFNAIKESKNQGPSCGNNICDDTENSNTCPGDCKPLPSLYLPQAPPVPTAPGIPTVVTPTISSTPAKFVSGDDIAYFYINYTGDKTVITSPDNRSLTIEMDISAGTAIGYVAKVRLSDGEVLRVRKANPDNTCGPDLSTNLIKTTGNLSGAAVDGTWILRKASNIIGLPAGTRLEIGGRTLSDVGSTGGDITTCGFASGSGNLSTVTLWNWHESPEDTYQTSATSSTNKAESPQYARYFIKALSVASRSKALPSSQSATANISEAIDHFKFNITVLVLGVFLVIIALQIRTIKELKEVRKKCEISR